MKKQPLLQAVNLTKRFTHPQVIDLIRGIDFSLYPKESIAIMGSSGVGKSTLLHILGTLESSTSGLLTIVGKPIEKFPLPLIRNRHIGFIFQAFNLLEDYSVIQNILMPARLKGDDVGPRSQTYERAIKLLERVDMQNRTHFSARVLSGGEKQRVAIARALINDPEILMADEPTGNLDEGHSEMVQDLLLQCVDDYGKGLIVVTHDPSLAKHCSQTLYLNEGKLYGSPVS